MEMGSITLIAAQTHSQKPNLWQASQAVEASFVAEMLKSAGFGKASGSFGGGVGEEQFASFLVEAQSKQLVQTQGFGIAEAVFRSMSEGAQ